MGLFLVVVSLATGSFITALRAQRASVELMAINDNANLTLEIMAREIRTGTGFSSLNPNELKFTNYLAQLVVYRFNPTIGVIEKSINGGGSFEPVTATNVNVKNLIFRVSGEVFGDATQPRVTIGIAIAGRTKTLEDVVTNIETTISPRILDS